MKDMRPRVPTMLHFGEKDQHIPIAVVREGVENDWPYIFTDTEFEPLIEARFAAIKQGFDRIRGREPRR